MSENHYYMACLDLAGRRAVVIGAGPVGLDKTLGLLAARAEVTVVAPRAAREVERLAAERRIEWEPRPYESSDLDGRVLVIAATSDRALNVRVHRDAEERGLLVNVADVPELCNFILPATHRDGSLAVAVSTAGASPALAKRMKRECAEAFGPAYARLAEILESLRPWARVNLRTYDRRKVFFEDVVEGDPDPIGLIEAAAEGELLERIERTKSETLRRERSGMWAQRLR